MADTVEEVRWTDAELDKHRQIAEDNFIEQRMEQGVEDYLEVYHEKESAVRKFFERTDDLREASGLDPEVVHLAVDFRRESFIELLVDLLGSRLDSRFEGGRSAHSSVVSSSSQSSRMRLMRSSKDSSIFP